MPFGPHSHLWPLPGPVRRAQRVDVDRHHPRGVRPVDERVDAAPVQLGDELGDRQDERGRAGDVADEERAASGR